uniref:Moubatin-like lipocalin n=1 Tax=Ornithodoros coriaceus TaxID=92741 RepID=B2D2D7_ORNCO|nr:moubatin-like lipocalin [Ornithodoros coriaceus]
MVQLTIVLTCCLLVNVAYGKRDRCKNKDIDAWKALAPEKGTTFLLVNSTRPDAEDCLKSTPEGTPQRPQMDVTMKFKSGGEWKTAHRKLTLEGPKITASFDSKKEEGRIVYRGPSCHVTVLGTGDTEIWRRQGARNRKDMGCCKKYFDEERKGKAFKKPQAKGCSS